MQSTYTYNMASSALFYLHKSVVSRLASGSLLAQPSAKFVIIFYRQENELCRTKMTLSGRNTKGKKIQNNQEKYVAAT